VVNNLRARLKAYEALLVKEGRCFRRYRFDEEILDQLSATLSSYLGHFKMANTYSLCRSLWERNPFLSQYFSFDPETLKLDRKYKSPKGFRRTRQQYLYYRWRFPGDVLLFNVGRFFELYHKEDKEVARMLDLSEMRKNQRGTIYGFPVNMINRFFWRLLQQKKSIVLILEREQYWTRIKERLPVYRFECLTD